MVEILDTLLVDIRVFHSYTESMSYSPFSNWTIMMMLHTIGLDQAEADMLLIVDS